jgi:hypothetical protein
MSEIDQEPTEANLNIGVQLLHRDLVDAYSFLGIQSERLEIAEKRIASGRPVPVWSDADASAKILSEQRAPLESLIQYTQRGLGFAQQLLAKIELQIREVLCNGNEIRPEIKEKEADAKQIIGYLATAFVGAIAVNIPVGVTGAAVASIATVIAVIVVKNQITRFCACGSEAIQLTHPK